MPRFRPGYGTCSRIASTRLSATVHWPQALGPWVLRLRSRRTVRSKASRCPPCSCSSCWSGKSASSLTFSSLQHSLAAAQAALPLQQRKRHRLQQPMRAQAGLAALGRQRHRGHQLWEPHKAGMMLIALQLSVCGWGLCLTLCWWMAAANIASQLQRQQRHKQWPASQQVAALAADGRWVTSRPPSMHSLLPARRCWSVD